MTISITRTARLVAPLATVALLAVAGSAQGRATVQPVYFQDTFTDSVDDSASCLGPGAVGTITGTVTLDGQFTDTYDRDPDPGGPRGFRFHGTETTDYRIAYDDGRSIVGQAVGHLAFTDNPNQLRTTLTEPVQDTGTLYDQSGRVLGTVRVRALEHVTYSDTNTNGEPDPGETTANVDQFRIDCP